MEPYSSISAEVLVRRCSESAEPALWEEFVRRFHRVIATVVMRTARNLGDGSRQTIDDLVQETYLKVCQDKCRLLREFDLRHTDAFYGFIKVIAANVVRDHFRARRSGKRDVDLLTPGADLDSVGSEKQDFGGSVSIERTLLLREIDAHLEACTRGPDQKRKCQIFWLYYRAGLSAAAIAVLPTVGLTTKGVESLILRITRDVRLRMCGPQAIEREPDKQVDKGILPA
jgi:RNA polymerase sigma-70 factor (ECF subfamily)